jgi:hypothetical protein
MNTSFFLVNPKGKKKAAGKVGSVGKQKTAKINQRFFREMVFKSVTSVGIGDNWFFGIGIGDYFIGIGYIKSNTPGLTPPAQEHSILIVNLRSGMGGQAILTYCLDSHLARTLFGS